jgi:CMP-N-acetylneuraminic acid synthetase
VNFIKRPDYLDLPESNFSQIFENFMNTVDSDIYVYAHATAPFISVDTMKECILAVSDGDYDSAFCAVKIQDYLWQDGEPLNFDAANIPRSQDIKPIYRETSGVYVFKKEVFELYHRRIGIKPYVKEVTYKEAVDINNPEDFKLAQAMLNIEL